MKRTFLLLIGLALSAAPMKAQTYNNLHNFTELNLSSSPPAWTNYDGANPQAGLILSGQTLYGTAEYGGQWGNGSIFAVTIDGTGFTNLYSFSADFYPYSFNLDGANPVCELVLSSNVLYGTASQGGNGTLNGNGTIFKINTDGSGFVNLHNFTGGDGGSGPLAGLVLSGDTLYGTTENGGSAGCGTIFSITTNGTDFKILYNFNWYDDGAYPVSKLAISGDTIYGTAHDGGAIGNGTVFKIKTDGTDFTILHSFTAGNNQDDNDGANPAAGLILSDDTLYGTTENYGGLNSIGTVFSIHTDGTTYTNLHSFTGGDSGGIPFCPLILSGKTLYGTATYGGASDAGMVFAINTDGSGFINLHSFAGSPSDGERSPAGLVFCKNTLNGTAGGGNSGYGMIFSLSLMPPPLAITPSATNVILTWPTYAPNVTLQCTTNLIPPLDWSTNLPPPALVDGQNTVTNPVSGAQMFFRLIQ